MGISGNVNITRHWTESHPAVISFLGQAFNGFPKESEKSDLEVDGKTIEVKSCREWCLTKHANGHRRRGRFYLAGHEKADYILFVVVNKKSFLFSLYSLSEIQAKYGAGLISIKWDEVVS